MKLDKINEIRRKVKLQSNNKSYFTKDEVQVIVMKINPQFNFNSVPFAQVLSASVPGWEDQMTIESHPSMKNLETIIKALKNKNYSLKRLLKLIDPELKEQSKSIKLNQKLLVIELK